MWLLPLAVMLIVSRDYLLHQMPSQRCRAALFTTLGLPVIGVILDVFFMDPFFVFDNHNAVFQSLLLPAVRLLPDFTITVETAVIPLEEFVFYYAGFACIILAYILCSEVWMSEKITWLFTLEFV